MRIQKLIKLKIREFRNKLPDTGIPSLVIRFLVLFLFLSVMVIIKSYGIADATLMPTVGSSTDFEWGEQPKFILDTNNRIYSSKKIVGRGEIAVDSGSVEAIILKDGVEVDNKPELVAIEKSDKVEVSLSDNSNIRPGKYSVSIKIKGKRDTYSLERDFTWGVLTINLYKSSYVVGERVLIPMAVLNNSGETDCGADLKLELTDPKRKKTVFKTSDGTITKSEECKNGNFTYLPDYLAEYTTETEGEYKLNLEINYPDGVRNIFDSFLVQSNNFVANRSGSAIRINPEFTYTNKIEISIGEDFSGNISEPVESEFEISNMKLEINEKDTKILGKIINEGPKKIILFENVTASKDDLIEVKYDYNAPDISPEIFFTGPLKMTELVANPDGEGSFALSEVFKESRSWQIASDATATYLTGSGNWTSPVTGNVSIECWGGGGAGGGQNQNSDGGGGGGGGAYAKKNTYAVTKNSTYAYSVGSGGTGVASSKGGDGGTTTFVTNVCVALGGTGGSPSTGTPPAGGAGGVGSSGTGDVKYSGGQGESGRNNPTGQGGYGGSSAGTGSDGFSGGSWSTVTYPTGSTPAGAGDGGNGGAPTQDGFAPASGSGGGGGGSGEGTAKVGGAGAAGKVIITYADNTAPSVSPNTGDANNFGTDSTPTLEFTGTDSDYADNIEYNIQIDDSSDCSSPILDKVSETDEGFVNTEDGGDTHPFTSAQKVSFTVQSGDALSHGTYYWRAKGKDPDGSNSYGSWTTIRSFIIEEVTTPITVSGTVWTNEAKTTNIGANQTVHLFVGSTDKSTYETNSSGFFTFSVTNVGAGTTVIAYLDGESDNGSVITLAVDGATDITSFDIVTAHVLLEHRTAGPITNADLDDIDEVDAEDEDGVTISNGLATFGSGFTLTINGSDTYTPGGSIFAENLYLYSSATLNGFYGVNISGGRVEGDGTITMTGGTFVVDGTGNFGGATDWTFYNLTFGDGNGSATTTKAGSNKITVSLKLNIMASQTLEAGSGTWTIEGGGVAALDSIKMIVGGYTHACALKEDGSRVYCWGSGSSGQLGNDATTYQLVPGEVLGLSGTGYLGDGTNGGPISQISAGYYNTCALKSDGSRVYCWGANGAGQIGINSTGSSQMVPVEVLGLSGTGYLGDGTNGGPISAITTGYYHSCALKSDGSRAYCWGSNSYGQIGINNTTTPQTVPVEVLGLSATGNLGDGTNGGPISEVVAGYYHTCALKSDGSRVYCWGYNIYGQIGINNTTTPQTVPVEVLGLSATGNLGDGTNGGPISKVVAGYYHTCALKSDGSRVYCWGQNTYGQIGINNTTTPQTVPVEVLGLSATGNLGDGTNGGPISAISAGGYHSCAVKSDGSRVYCWGQNTYYQIGINTPVSPQTVPVQVLGLSGTGYLGDGTNGGPISQISGGYYNSCALKSDGGSAYCWGYNNVGQVGVGYYSTYQKVPIAVVAELPKLNYLSDVSTISSGVGDHVCALKSDGSRVYCWGYNYFGELGNNNVENPQRAPTVVAGLLGVGYLGDGTNGGPISKIAVGADHSCALKSDGSRVYCWGYNIDGEVGINNTTNPQTVPIEVLGLSGTGNLGDGTNGGPISEISAGGYHTCALKSDNSRVYCWGKNDVGQMGINNVTTPQTVPVEVLGLSGTGKLGDGTNGGPILTISGGAYHTCALKSDNSRVYCWGRNDVGQMGINNVTTPQTVPVEVLGLSGTGKLGDGTNGGPISQISSGGNHSCALKSDGSRVYCWGKNDQYQMGINDSTTPQTVPVEVLGLSATGYLGDGTNGGPISEISAGGYHSCALKSDGSRMYCWGGNASGELGLSTIDFFASVPTEVLGLSGDGYLGDGTNGGPISGILAAGSRSYAIRSDNDRVYGFGDNTNGAVGNCDISSAADPAVEVRVAANQPFENSGTLTAGSSTFEFTGATVPMPKQFSSNALFETNVEDYSTYNNLKLNGSGKTFSLSGTTDVNGNVDISAGTLTVSSEDYGMTVGGSWSNSGTFVPFGGTVTFDDTAGSKTLSGTMTGSSSFYDLIFNGSGGGWSVNGDLAAEGDFDLTNGALTQGADVDLTLYGNVTLGSSSTFTKASGSGVFIMDGDAETEEFDDQHSTKVDLGSVQIGLSPGTTNLKSDMSATDLTISAGDALNTKGYEITLSDFLTCNGTLNVNDTSETDDTFITLGGNFTMDSGATYTDSDFDSEIVFTGNSSADQTFTTAGKSYGRATVNNNQATYDGVVITGNLVLNGALTVSDGDLDLITAATDPNVNTAGNVTISSGATVTKGTGTWTFDGSSTTLSDSNSSKQDLGAVTIGPSTTTSVATNTGVKMTTLTVGSNDTLDITDDTLTIGGTGTPLAINSGGTFTTTGSTVEYIGTTTATNVTTTAYNNLSINPTSSTTYSLTGHMTSANSAGISGNLTIGANATLTTTGSNYNIEVGKNWSNSGSFTAGSGTVTFRGTSESIISGDTTFYNLTMNTTTDGAKTIKFTAASTQTISNTWTLDGDSGKVLTLRSTSDDTAWEFVIPANINPAGDYIDVKDSQNNTNAYRITPGTNTTNSGNNVPGWLFSTGGNTAPNSPEDLAQKKTDDTLIIQAEWTNETSVKFTATASDNDPTDTLYLCVEKDQTGTAFSDTNDSCGSGVPYVGIDVTVSVTIGSLTAGTSYHWQARVKDFAGDYSSWVSFGTNNDPNDRDFGVDTAGPTLTDIWDGTDSGGSDIDYNDGSLDTLEAKWTAGTDSHSGIDYYEYSIGTTVGGTDIVDWTDNGTDVYFSDSSLSLRTGKTYYTSVKAFDNVGNESSVITSDGQAVAPTITFGFVSGGSITFNDLNSGNSWTDSSKSTVMRTSTNAYNGYVVNGRALDELRLVSNPSYYIPHYGSGNSSPSSWTGEGFGYTTNDSDLSGGTADRFTNGGPKYAGFDETTMYPVADHSAKVSGTPIVDEDFTLSYRVTGGETTVAGFYSTTLILTCIPQY